MNKNNDLFFNKKDIEKIIKENPTPFHLYDEKGIIENAKLLYNAFSWNVGFKNYFAIKACPNPYIIKILKEQGCGADCSSLPELLLAEKVGFKGEEIMFTSNDTPANEFKKAMELGAIINLDDITHIEFLEKSSGIPSLICFRYNPGPLRQTKEGNVIGNPESAKYGLTKKQLFEAYEIMKNKGVKRFGLHTMIASNELDYKAFVETAKMLLELVNEISNKLGIEFEFINLGGGIGIPYKPEQKPIDLSTLSNEIRKVYEDYINNKKVKPIKIFMENGRMMTGPFGYLITKTIHEKHIYKEYVGVDACMANLMRPGMYGAYHHITILGKENLQNTNKYDIVGSLCENNDKFAIDRMLPKIEIGDLIAIHNAGAHGHAMGFNYNGKLRSAELLMHINKAVSLIRRAETVEDYFATLDFKDSEFKELAKNKKVD
ncbi:MAG: diaminopimelate decarboxylase [Candidatus Micrarchaeaceae archaeon]